MVKEILTFGDTEIQKKKKKFFTTIRLQYFLRCRY